MTFRFNAPAIRLGVLSLPVLLTAGSVFVLMRYLRLSNQGEGFAYSFEIGRMLINFGGMALISPMVYWAVKLGSKHPSWRIPAWLTGLLGFALSYLLLNQLGLNLLNGPGITNDLWKSSQKLFLNFGHILTLFYLVMAYGFHTLLKSKVRDSQPKEEHAEIQSIPVSIGGLNRQLSVKDIEYISTFDHYLKIHQQGHFGLIRQPLSQLMPTLNEDFVQIHRSTVINKQHAHGLFRRKGSWWVKMNYGEPLRMSASFEESALEKLQQS